jgi:beta-galactosidase
MPGPLAAACGFTYQEFSNLKKELALKGDPFQAGEQNRVSSWAEFLLPSTAKPLAYYDHPFFGKYPAITRNQFGEGTLTYEGTVLSDGLQSKVLLEVLRDTGLAGPDQQLASPLKVKHGIGNSGKRIHFYLNYSGQSQAFGYPYPEATDLLSGKVFGKGQSCALQEWDLAILEER